MIIIHTALYPEAKALIEHFNLKRDLDFPVFELYRNDDTAILISGIGKINTAIALTATIIYLKNHGLILQDTTLVNFGVAGGTPDLTIGNLFYIQKINDYSTKSSFYPDLIFKNNLTKIDLTTFDRPVRLEKFPQLFNTLVDMEASSFFQTANKFFDTHQIHSLKILIDHLRPEDFKLDTVSLIINENFPELLKFLNSLPKNEIAKEQVSLNELAKQKEIEKITEDLRLSKAQSQQLSEIVDQYQTLTKLLFEDFIRTYHYKISEHKSINTNSFEKLKAKLLIEINKKIGN